MYGIDFLKIDEIERQLALMLEQPDVRVLSDLRQIHYQGGLLKQGTSLRDSFFADCGLGEHKALKDRFAYDPERPIAEYVPAVRGAINELKEKYADADAAWRMVTAGFLAKYQLRGWTWAAWKSLDDSAVRNWRAMESESGRQFDVVSLKQLSGQLDVESVSWETVINAVRADVAKDLRKLEEDGRSKAKVLDVELTLPIGLILTFFRLVSSPGLLCSARSPPGAD